MTKRDVRFLRVALADLAEISAYLSIEAPDAERRIVERLVATAESLALHAERAPVARDPGLRARGFRATRCDRYILFYKVRLRVVAIHRVLHERRAWARLV
jgi:plasmid stabilization system protein ParE